MRSIASRWLALDRVRHGHLDRAVVAVAIGFGRQERSPWAGLPVFAGRVAEV